MGNARSRVLRWLEHDFRIVAAVQRAMGVREGKALPPWHPLFTFGAFLGNEIFYTLFLTALFWLESEFVGRRTLTLWAAIYYVGQVVKDLAKLPRPSRASGALPLENHYEAEYGLPSTHVMAAVSLPFQIAEDVVAVASAIAASGVRDPAGATVAACAGGIARAWCAVMTTSRIYLGVHSVTDMAVGAALGTALRFAQARYASDADSYLLSSAAWVAPAIAAALTGLYPIVTRPKRWTNAYGDTTLILGVWGGSMAAARLMTAAGEYTGRGAVTGIALIEAANGGTPGFAPLAGSLALTALARCAIGYPLVILTRAIVKTVSIRTLVSVLPHDDAPPARRYAVEIPSKYLTYLAVGFNSVYTVPRVFKFLGI